MSIAFKQLAWRINFGVMKTKHPTTKQEMVGGGPNLLSMSHKLIIFPSSVLQEHWSKATQVFPAAKEASVISRTARNNASPFASITLF